MNILKRFFTIFLILTMTITLCGTTFAADPGGGSSSGGSSAVFMDAVYGAGIGALLGLTIYMIDTEKIQSKLGVGILIGLVAGAYYGVSQSKAAIEIDNKEVKLAPPLFFIEKVSNNVTIYGTTVLNVAL
ncbi:MAG: hypothetical protein HQK91_08990 [Nitrospirae bacterium]|nr:hypothetical protein [Nitrospirota bacterium]